MNSSARPMTRPLVGIVLVDKPAGLTSNRILQKTKRLFKAEKAGHTGTLDPMATGMLPICFGAATKVTGLMLASSKRYRVTALFGIATDTGDATGAPITRCDGPAISRERVEAAVLGFLGRSRQVPPMYSAVKHGGKRLYELARRGEEVERKERPIEIFDITIDEFSWPQLSFSVHCSKGTYVRSLVTDIARKVDSVAHVSALRRLSVAPFDEPQMVSFETLESAAAKGLAQLDRCLLGADAALTHMPAVGVSSADGVALRQGRRVNIEAKGVAGDVRIYDSAASFVGIGKLEQTGLLRPARIFPAETLVPTKVFG